MEFPETRNDYAFKLQKEIQTCYSKMSCGWKGSILFEVSPQSGNSSIILPIKQDICNFLAGSTLYTNYMFFSLNIVLKIKRILGSK